MARLIVATKTTVWELYGSWYELQFNRGAIKKRDFERIRTAHDEHLLTVETVRKRLDVAQINYRVVNVDDADWAIDSDTDVLLTLGGDGTLLSASHRVTTQKVVLYGLRSSGTSVGFLCAGGIERLDECIASIQKNSFNLINVPRLQAEIYPVSGEGMRLTPPALNDFLYSNTNPAATTRYRLSLGDRTEEHKSSGLWISTALGSTAGISAAGGILQPRTDENFQYLVRELYRPAGKNFYLINGFFNGNDKQLMIENRCDQAILAADGNHGIIKVSWGDRMILKRAATINIAVGA